MTVRFYRIPVESMENTLLVGDQIVVSRVGLSKTSRGGIIVFPYPPDPTKMFIKRVIGISGDHLRIIDKKVYVNGTVVDEPYAVYKFKKSSDERSFPGNPAIPFEPRFIQLLKNNVVNGEVIVPPNSYFVMGDNRDSSLDSRYWGFVPADSVIGHPLFVYWSSDNEGAGIRWNRFFHGIH